MDWRAGERAIVVGRGWAALGKVKVVCQREVTVAYQREGHPTVAVRFLKDGRQYGDRELRLEKFNDTRWAGLQESNRYAEAMRSIQRSILRLDRSQFRLVCLNAEHAEHVAALLENVIGQFQTGGTEGL